MIARGDSRRTIHVAFRLLRCSELTPTILVPKNGVWNMAARHYEKHNHPSASFYQSRIRTETSSDEVIHQEPRGGYGGNGNLRKLVSAVLERIGQMRTRADDSEELKQAGVRVIISALAVLYIAATTYGGVRIAPPIGITVLFLFYFPFSCLLWWWMKTRPSERPWRRTIAIFCDMPALTFAMSVGGASMLPIFALLLWVAVGNGLRFGPRHLVASTVVALLSIAVATIFNVYLRQNPYIVVTLTATAVLVPAYIYVLLDRAHRASQAAQEANISKSRFLAQASHDLRQPVHAISLFTACLR